jgi:hypothetical protein
MRASDLWLGRLKSEMLLEWFDRELSMVTCNMLTTRTKPLF